MSYMENPPRRPWRTRLQRSPLIDPPQVDDAVRDRVVAEADRYPNATAAELSAFLSYDGEPVDTLTVRAVLEA